MQKIIKSNKLKSDLEALLVNISFDKIFVLVDENTANFCLKYIDSLEALHTKSIITIRAGDENKNLESLVQIWRHLSEHGASRHSLLINLGGGMLTDIGGFAAASFKRGIRSINIPTTLLGAVDAAVGGKTGINFGGLKNEIGAFYSAEAVLIHADFFKTLDKQNLLSGYAEMLKHGLIDSDSKLNNILAFNLNQLDYQELNSLVFDSVKVKERIVQEDPFEHGIRKALNLGHTIGHAFESLSHQTDKPIPHGYAVIWGIVCELYLSCKLCDFPNDKYKSVLNFIGENYPIYPFNCKDYEQLYEYMKHDKKNTSNYINFTLLADVGDIKINQTASKENIFEALDFARDSMGL